MDVDAGCGGGFRGSGTSGGRGGGLGGAVGDRPGYDAADLGGSGSGLGSSGRGSLSGTRVLVALVLSGTGPATSAGSTNSETGTAVTTVPAIASVLAGLSTACGGGDASRTRVCGSRGSFSSGSSVGSSVGSSLCSDGIASFKDTTGSKGKANKVDVGGRDDAGAGEGGSNISDGGKDLVRGGIEDKEPLGEDAAGKITGSITSVACTSGVVDLFAFLLALISFDTSEIRGLTEINLHHRGRKCPTQEPPKDQRQ